MSDSLRPHESQHTRPPCPSPTPAVYSNLCPSSQWCHPTISSSVIPFSSCPQSLPASGSFPLSQLFTWGGQSTRVSASAPVLPGLNYFRMDWLDLLAVQGTLKSLLQHHSSKAAIFWHSAFFTVQLSHPYMTTGKTIALTRWTFVGKVMSLPAGISRDCPGNPMIKTLPSKQGVQAWSMVRELLSLMPHGQKNQNIKQANPDPQKCFFCQLGHCLSSQSLLSQIPTIHIHWALF